MTEEICQKCGDKIKYKGKGKSLEIISVHTDSLVIGRMTLTAMGINLGGHLNSGCDGENCLARRLYNEKWRSG